MNLIQRVKERRHVSCVRLCTTVVQHSKIFLYHMSSEVKTSKPIPLIRSKESPRDGTNNKNITCAAIERSKKEKSEDKKEKNKVLRAFPKSCRSKEELEQCLRDFVHKHESRGGGKQRSAGWYKMMEHTFGGSEMSALMGMNKYKKYWQVIASKTGLVEDDFNIVACWWGSMFEDVVARVIEVDCETTIIGDEICIQEIPNHRLSPDGYAVVGVFTNARGELEIWTPMCPVEEPEMYVIVIFEIKSPKNRIPDGDIAREYKPQVWAGLVASPIAHFGVFVDAVFRRCSLRQLTNEPLGYNIEYHSSDVRNDRPPPFKDRPFAWGLIAVYAPNPDAPRELRVSKKDTDIEGNPVDVGAEMWYLGKRYEAELKDRGDSTRETSETTLIDLGECSARMFETVLRYIDQKLLRIKILDPCLYDGRGLDLHIATDVDTVVNKLKAFNKSSQNYEADEHFTLIGVLPWKLFEMHYVLEQRKPGFQEDIKGLVSEAYEIVQEVREVMKTEGNAEAWIRLDRIVSERIGEKANRTSSKTKKQMESMAEMTQDLFDFLAENP